VKSLTETVHATCTFLARTIHGHSQQSSCTGPPPPHPTPKGKKILTRLLITVFKIRNGWSCRLGKFHLPLSWDPSLPIIGPLLLQATTPASCFPNENQLIVFFESVHSTPVYVFCVSFWVQAFYFSFSVLPLAFFLPPWYFTSTDHFCGGLFCLVVEAWLCMKRLGLACAVPSRLLFLYFRNH